MLKFLLGFILIVYCTPVVWAKGENEYLMAIKELLKKDTPQGNPALVKYLESLTKDQTLTALRQLGKEVESKTPVEMWSRTETTVGLLMLCYAEPIQLSDEEFDNLPNKAKRDLQAGLLRGPLSDEAFDKLIAGIANRKEGSFFRYALAGYSTFKEGLGPQLSEAQKERLFETCLAVMRDRESSNVVRSKCCDAVKEVLRREGWHIIYADDKVKNFMRASSAKQRRNLDSLLNSGEIKLTPETVSQLAPWRKKMKEFKYTLDVLQDDKQESKSFRERAKKYSNWLDHSPLINAKGNTLNSPKD